MKGAATVLPPTVMSKGGCQAWQNKEIPDLSLCKGGAFIDSRGEGVGDWDEDFGQVHFRFSSKRLVLTHYLNPFMMMTVVNLKLNIIFSWILMSSRIQLCSR